LRPPQLRALETYWYLRLVERTPHIFDLYQKLFPPDDPGVLLNALGISPEAFQKSRYNLPALWARIKTDDEFVREFRLEALRETLTLGFSSYILASAIGVDLTGTTGTSDD
jgi:type III restriction enzyme